MRTRTVAAFMAVAALISACRAEGRDDGSALDSLKRANAAYDQALIAGDAVALDRFYTDDFQIIDDNANIHGKAGQINFMTKEVDLLSAKSDQVRITMLAPDSALMTGRFTGRYRYRGEERDFVERYTAVWVREKGDWKLKHEHSSLVPEQSQRPAGA